MNRKLSRATLFVPTLLDADGSRHIIPAKDKPALCGATGAQAFPHDHRARDLCQRCVQKHARDVLDIRLGELGL